MPTVTETMGDAAASADTHYSMTPGDSFTGRLGERFDEDWIRIELQAGLTYEINLTGDGSDGAADTILRIYNSAGAQVAVNDDVDFAAGNLFSKVTFTPETSSAYYISAGSYSANPNQENWGDYRLTVPNPGGSEPMDEDNDMMGEDGDVMDEDDVEDESEIGEAGEVFEGSPDSDTLTGGPGNDELYGQDGDDVLDGRGGNDWLEGGRGADELRGGPGEDTASFKSYSPAEDVLGIFDETGQLTGGTTTVRRGVEVRLQDGTFRGGHAEGDTFGGMQMIAYIDGDGNTQMVEVSDIENLFGSDGEDMLVGAHGANQLDGYEGGDMLDGREGDDRLFGGNGSDLLTGGPGADLLSGGNHYDYAVYRFSEAGVVVRLHTVLETGGQGGDAEGDTFVSQTLPFTDEEGNTRMVEVPDIEILVGSDHGDVLAGDFRFNILWGRAGDDKLYGGPDGGNDSLFGGSGNDQVFGGKGSDLLYGGDGDDLLRGGPGDDTLEAVREERDLEKSNDQEIHLKVVRFDSGDDRLDGGTGDDVFYFFPEGGDDVILDFGNGEDRIDLTAFEDIQSLDDLSMQQQGENLMFDLSSQGGGTITLLDFNEVDLVDAHFIFFTDDFASAA